MNTPPLVDPAVYAELQATAGADFVVELVDTFLAEAPQMLAEMQEALAAGSAERFRRAAHSLKTNAYTFGATQLGEAARALEHGGLPADDGGVEALRAAYGPVAARLRELAHG